MKKCIIIISLLVLIIASTVNVYATENDAKNVVKSFLSCIDRGDSRAATYIDSSNAELYNTIQEKIESFSSVDYEIKKITQNGDTYKIDAIIKAEGVNWSVEGITAHFDVKYNNGTYIITDTNFFEITSPEHIAGMAISIVVLVFIILGIVFFTIIIIIVIVVIVVNKNKNK